MVVLKETHFVTPHHLTEILNEGQTTAIEQNRMRGGLSTKEGRKVGAHPGGTITSTNRNHLGESTTSPNNSISSLNNSMSSTENTAGSLKDQITSTTPLTQKTDTTKIPTDTKNLSIQMVNVCGLRNKLDIPEFRDTLEMYDISLLCESLLDKVD